MGRLGPGPGRAGPLGPPGAVDPLPLKGALQRPNRGDRRAGAGTAQLDLDSAGAPTGVLPLELTGATQDGGVGLRSGLPAGLRAGDETVWARIAVGAPEGADGGVRQVQFVGDPPEGLAVEVAADDVLADGQQDGARHEESSRGVSY